MKEEADQLILKKNHIATVLLILQIYPFYIAWTAYRLVPKLSEVLDGILGESTSLPFATQILQSTYRWWIAFPLLTTSLALACFHRKVKSLALPSLVFILTLLLSYMMRVMLAEGTLAPLIKLVTIIGE
jgi:hypothetical protein